MGDTARYSDLRDYLRVVRANWWLILAVGVVFAGAAYFLESRGDKEYEAEAKLSVGQVLNPQADVRPAITADSIRGIDIASRVEKDLKTRTGAGRLRSAINPRVEPRTGLVSITARWGEPRFAARVANAFARSTVKTATAEQRARIERQIRNLRRRLREIPSANRDQRRTLRTQLFALQTGLAQLEDQIRITRVAEVRPSPVAPRPLRNGLLGLIVGLTLGIVAAFVRDALDRRLRGSRELQEHLDMPVLGHVSERALGRIPGADGGDGISEPDLEAFRILRLNLQFSGALRTLAVTSGLPEEGKSTVALFLSSVSVSAGKRTLLVECDLRRPSIAGRLAIPVGPGLTECMEGTASFEEAIQEVSVGPAVFLNGEEPGGPAAATLSCITAGSKSRHPGAVLGSTRFTGFLDRAKRDFDLVVLDTAPLLSVVDTRELLPHVDGFLLCVRAAKTTAEEVDAAKEALEHLPTRPVGAVVTGLRAGDEHYYGYYGETYGSERKHSPLRG
jgi:capsular exopolysaccharide synthesis family protein